ncbi:ABC transporter permease [Georgenia sp. SYP-B2076]|uniref:ABC transporter permease n=1 Tax=Georgenia sp. SYP-B2076 TaxID=2495881 RepID=UPI000F8E8989|nr:ABC transporter permease subunit [Georgenia sp. SYP-B2076]
MSTPDLAMTRSRTTSLPKIRLSRNTVGPVLLAVAVLVLWQISSGLVFVIPSPAATVGRLVENISDPRYRTDLAVTALATVQAFVIGAGIGFVLGLLLGFSDWAKALFEPLLVAFNGIPKIVLYPVLLQLFSLSGGKIAMGILFALFPVFVNVATGVRELPRVYWKLALSTRASRWQRLVHIVLPGIRKPLLTGVRLSVSLAMSGVVLSEFFATDRGLGRVVLQAFSHAEYATMVATLLLLVVTSFVISVGLWNLEKKVR